MNSDSIKIFKNKQDCCGCTACMTVCPKAAIKMNPDEKGFLYPEIDDAKCVKCGLCVKTCTFQNGYKTPDNFDTPLVYAVKHKKLEERLTSRSGGMFIAAADWILENGGVIYGAGYGDNFYVMHKRADNKKDLFEFKGSKYVQSDMNTIFSQVIDDLKKDRYVLFSGTPCQTSGLYSCLKNVNTEKLYVCDLVCHGTPSPYAWRDYLEFSKKKYKSNVVKTDFRDKSFGWFTHIESLWFENGKKVSSEIYTKLFYMHIMFRPSCGNCKYTNTRRPSDFTIADFWGIGKAVPGFNDNKGVSLVFLNTEKGKKLFETVSDNIEYKPSRLEDCMQHNMKAPSVFSESTDEFWKDYLANGFGYVAKKYGAISFKNEMRLRLKIYLKPLLIKMGLRK
ncbi:MAG: Coenzyme F420 hydrogenase/dehydrogenase, beta subunit C-terminal domain [Ruminococcus sp.]|nr:Coenzyme F420 hydrogenase/dehydrogenase, beta subunit C-terminal domain [Ruminococcus sp.]